MTSSPAGQRQGSDKVDMEQVFFRMHVKLIDQVTRVFSVRWLRIFEYLAVLNAVGSLLLLVSLHVTFVHAAAPLGSGQDGNCVAAEVRAAMSAFPGARAPDVVRLQVGGIWSRLAQVDSDGAAALDQARLLHGDDVIAPELMHVWLQDPEFLYSRERGFLMLDAGLRAQHGISELNMTLSLDCLRDDFGAAFELLTFALDNFVGYDTVVANALIHANAGQGFMYSVLSRDLRDLRHGSAARAQQSQPQSTSSQPQSQSSSVLASFIAFKVGIVAITLFLFFITTTLVHHTLLETQEMMLRFTVDLQRRLERRLPYGPLVLNHVVNSLVFVPITVRPLALFLCDDRATQPNH